MGKPKSEPTDRLMIERIVDFDEAKVLDVPLVNTIAFLQDLQNQHPEHNLYLSLDVYGYNSSDVSLQISYQSPETDEEFSERKQGEERQKEIAADIERKRIEREKDMQTLRALERKLGMERR